MHLAISTKQNFEGFPFPGPLIQQAGEIVFDDDAAAFDRQQLIAYLKASNLSGSISHNLLDFQSRNSRALDLPSGEWVGG
jgi:hypothetical protein